MSTELINNLPIIAIMTPFILAFVLGLFKDKYIAVYKPDEFFLVGLFYCSSYNL